MQAIDIYRKLVELIDGGGAVAVATVLSTEGSTPQRPGAKAVIDAAGRLWGTVGGGAVEGETLRSGVAACRSQSPVVLDFQLENDDAEQAGAICGGRMRILVDPTVARHRACYAAAADTLRQRRRCVLLTTIHQACPCNVSIEWLAGDAAVQATGFPGGAAIQSCLERGRAERFVENTPAVGAATEVFVDPVVPQPLLLIAGGGHVGQALAAQAITIGFDVVVIDDRPAFCDPALFPPTVQTRCGPVAQLLGDQPMDDDTFVVIVTRGHQHDAEALAACIRRRPTYLGMIGSRRKVALLRKHFVETGLATESEFDRVFAPVGLAVGAETVAEIAVSIAAQLIAVRRKKLLGDCPKFCGRTPQKWDCPPWTRPR
jgi:xanthine dehydrogenase accessory factor